jgi:hypothetical protein
MNKFSINAMLFLSTIFGFSQTTTIPKGTYTANEGGLDITLTLREDNTYELSYLRGVLERQNDFAVKLKSNAKTSSFNLEYTFDKKLISDKIKIKLSSGNVYDGANIYVGIQNGETTPDYKSIATIKKGNETIQIEEPETGDFVFELKRSEFLNLAYEDYDLKTEISRFKIPENVSEIAISYKKNYLRDLNLQGIYDTTTKVLTVSENGKSALKFTLDDKTLPIKEDFTKPIAIEVKNNWTFPGKEINKVITEETVAMAVDTTTTEAKQFVFQHQKSNSFNEALQHIAKTPKKFLVVSFDLNNKNRKTEFDEFIRNSEKEFANYMYYGYKEEYDNFNFYLATDNDKKLLSKYKIKSDKEVLILNSKGDLLYHTKGSLKEKIDLVGVYDNAISDFNKANQQLEFDKVILNKKSTNKEVLNVLKKNYDFVKVPVIADKDAIKFTPPVAVKTDVNIEKESDEEEVKEVKTDAVVDTVATATYSDYYDYSIIKDPKNLYKLKTTYKNVSEKWLKIVKDFKKNNTYDADYLFVLKQELIEDGFSKRIFDKTNTFETNFEILDYVFANYKTIKKDENKESKVADAVLPEGEETTAVATMDEKREDEMPYVAGIDTVLENYFYKISNAEYSENQKELCVKGFKYYKKFIELQDFKSSKVRNYLNALSNNLNIDVNLKEYFEVFEDYFNKIVSPNKNLIESLDADFTANTDNESDWKNYKDNFATDCNLAAWTVVKDEKNTNQIQKAFKWSETSLQLQKDSHYFWDTLGQLFYLNGQKDKAIEAEQKAIEFAKDTDNDAEYTAVLEKMKTGSYPIPRD